MGGLNESSSMTILTSLSICFYVGDLETKGTGKRGHIVAHDVSWAAQTGKHLLRTQNVSEQNKKHFFVSRTHSDTNFVSATNVACAGNRGNICVGNNVSSFASETRDTKSLNLSCNIVSFYVFVDVSRFSSRAINLTRNKNICCGLKKCGTLIG